MRDIERDEKQRDRPGEMRQRGEPRGRRLREWWEREREGEIRER